MKVASGSKRARPTKQQQATVRINSKGMCSNSIYPALSSLTGVRVQILDASSECLQLHMLVSQVRLNVRVICELKSKFLQ